MTDITPRAGAPLLGASQAQKHVTHNEALYQFDALLCARFLDRDLSTPPSAPADGDTYLVKATGTGLWTGQDGKIAYSADGGWRFFASFAGLVAFVADEGKLIVFDGSTWIDYASLLPLQNLPLLGVNTTADSTNKLAVQSNAALFCDVSSGSDGTGDMRVTLSKQAAGNTASLVLQDNFSGRAEIGLSSDDNLHFKVSPDGSSWTDALDIAGSTGAVTIPSAHITGGTIDAAALGGSSPSSAVLTTLAVRNGGTVALFGADSGAITLTDATSKFTRLGAPHYLNAEESVAMIIANNSSSSNVLTIGGGTGLMNAATSIAFACAANNTTVTGSTVLSLSSSVATFSVPPRTPSYTVSGLPSASSAGAGARAFVTDSNATTFLATVAGGGANKVPVVSDGTNWKIG